jgi:hypothetical protein
LARSSPPKGSHHASTFRQNDAARLLRAAMAAGIERPIVEFDPASKILRVTGAKPASKQADGEAKDAD